MVVVFVVFNNTVEFRISAVYLGGDPLAEHDSMPPFIANAAAGNSTVGGTNQSEIIQAFRVEPPQTTTFLYRRTVHTFTLILTSLQWLPLQIG